MEEYRVLLADDEEEIRTGISLKIDWSALGFSLVGEAGNGEEALELAEQLRPDVVLTDIKMPFMDGLELCRRLRQSLPGARLVVFSGFDDFEYARQAVSMGVSEYILKPINAPELSQVLTRLREQLDRQRLERRDMETLRRRYEESLPVLRELFYTRLLGGQLPPEQIQDRAARYEIELRPGLWTAALVHADLPGEGEEDRDELLLLSGRCSTGTRRRCWSSCPGRTGSIPCWRSWSGCPACPRAIWGSLWPPGWAASAPDRRSCTAVWRRPAPPWTTGC